MREVVLLLLFFLLRGLTWFSRAIRVRPETSTGHFGCHVLGSFLVSDNMKILSWCCVEPRPILFFGLRSCHHRFVLLLRLVDFGLFDLVKLVQFCNNRGFVLYLLVDLSLQKFWLPHKHWSLLLHGFKAVLLLLDQVVSHCEVRGHFNHLRLDIFQLFVQRSVLEE